MNEPDGAKGYTVFAMQKQPAMCCAVPLGHDPPAFIDEARWKVLGSMHDAKPLAGFDPDAARFALRLQGFYVFRRGRRIP